jgi:TonB family protein
VFETKVSENSGVGRQNLYFSFALHAGVILLALLVSTIGPVRSDSKPVSTVFTAEVKPNGPVLRTPVVPHKIKIGPSRRPDSLSTAQRVEAEVKAMPAMKIQAPAVDTGTVEPPTVVPSSLVELADIRDTVAPVERVPDNRIPFPLDLQPEPPVPPEPDNKPPIRIGGRVEPPQILVRKTPKYPANARSHHVQGVVVLSATITDSGNVGDIEVVSGHELLINAAIDCVRQWRYRPGKLNGVPIAVPLKVEVRFQLVEPNPL